MELLLPLWWEHSRGGCFGRLRRPARGYSPGAAEARSPEDRVFVWEIPDPGMPTVPVTRLSMSSPRPWRP